MTKIAPNNVLKDQIIKTFSVLWQTVLFLIVAVPSQTMTKNIRIKMKMNNNNIVQSYNPIKMILKNIMKTGHMKIIIFLEIVIQNV